MVSDRASRVAQRQLLENIQLLSVSVKDDVSKAVLSLIRVVVMNTQWHVEVENMLFTRKWEPTQETFNYLKSKAEEGLRLWELNEAANPRLVCCFRVVWFLQRQGVGAEHAVRNCIVFPGACGGD